VDLVCEDGGCPEIRHGGTRWIAAGFGDRYSIRVWNRSERWVEAVVAVDGRDVLNGQRASASNRGYLIAPYSSIDVDGFRTSDTEVAAFRFTSVWDSYAGRVDGGGNAGKVEVKFFPGSTGDDRPVVPVPREPYWGHRRHHGSGAEASRTDSPAPEGLSGDREESAAKASDAAPPSTGGAVLPRHRRPQPAQELGTQYGESRWSEVRHVDFRRDRRSTPADTEVLRYDSWNGLMSKGVPVRPPIARPQPYRHDVPYSRQDGYVPPPPGY
jgi:hypothetical protein